jgi:hypothetical protein
VLRSSSATRALVVGVALLLAMALASPAAWAGPGYQPDSSKPSFLAAAEIPSGISIDQASQNVYVAELSKNLFSLDPGQVEQFAANGTPTASSPFTTGGEDFFTAVAVNSATHDVYGYQLEGNTPLGHAGISQINVFSSTGTVGTSFGPGGNGALQIAADASGRVYFPNTSGGSIKVFDSAGSLKETITCGGCPGGVFVEPAAVALDGAGNLYVVDRAGASRVIKLSSSGGAYTYESTLQSGRGARGIGIDPASGDVFVSDRTEGTYHLVAYDASGTQLDDFAAGLSAESQVEGLNGQVAVNSTTHDVYFTDPGGKRILVFERIGSIPPPTVKISPASPVGQVEATLQAVANPKGHVLGTCQFEYTTDADFQVNGYANAKTAACPAVIGNPEDTSVAAKVTGLLTSTTYHYRIRVASNGGPAESASETFETLPPLPPVVSTGSASSVTKTGATLGGSVNPKGGTISNCHFEYVTEAKFAEAGFTGATSKVCSTVPSGNVASSVSAKVTGLAIGTTYRFRVVATNNSGTSGATEQAFTTVAETCASNPTLCPPPTEPQAPVSQPSSATPLPVTTPTPKPKPLKCRKGFKKKIVRGKAKCVKVKKAHAKRHN